jgi:DNA-binding CsgD family transcriptional regulator
LLVQEFTGSPARRLFAIRRKRFGAHLLVDGSLATPLGVFATEAGFAIDAGVESWNSSPVKLAYPATLALPPRSIGARNGNCHPLLRRRGDSALDRALLALHGSQEMREFWDRSRRVLHAALPLHFVCLCLRPFAVMPSTVFRERAPFASDEEFRRFQELNPIGQHLVLHPGERLTRLSDVVSGNLLVRSEFYRRFLEPHDDRYFVSLNFWRDGVFQGIVGLHRTPGQRDFTESEMALLAQLYAHFDTVLQRILDLHRERAVRLSLEKLLVELPIATVLVDWDLHVVYHNRSAIEQCAVWIRGPERARVEKIGAHCDLPAEILAYCRDFKAAWNPVLHRCCPLASPEGITLQHATVPTLRATVNLLQLNAAPLSMPIFQVRFVDAGAGSRNGSGHGAALPLLARLTPREREVAHLTSEGLSNDEIAARLHKSSLTVKKQLRSIYQKLSVRSRSRLIALLRA